MAYEPKPGQGSLFHNDRREKDTHPHYKGSLTLPDGTEHWLSGWVKKNDDGSFKLLSLALGDPKQPKAAAGGQPDDFDDDSAIPF